MRHFERMIAKKSSKGFRILSTRAGLTHLNLSRMYFQDAAGHAVKSERDYGLQNGNYVEQVQPLVNMLSDLCEDLGFSLFVAVGAPTELNPMMVEAKAVIQPVANPTFGQFLKVAEMRREEAPVIAETPEKPVER